MTPRRLLPALLIALALCLTGAWGSMALAQDAAAPGADTEAVVEGEGDSPLVEAGDETAAAPVQAEVDDPMQLVTVNWWEETKEGGITMVFLGILSVLMVAFAIERLIVLRSGRFVPRKLAADVRPMFLKGDFDGVLARCQKSNTTLARVIEYMTQHRDADPMLLAQSAGDLGARELADQEARNVPFTVIAALAPLLGLLGTMIGMIEAFKLVEVFGDEGGASMLAGSISKALITTAVGLILAIPAIALYHIFKHRLHGITQRLENEVEGLFSAWFVLPKDQQPAAHTPERKVAAPAISTTTPVSPTAPVPAAVGDVKPPRTPQPTTTFTSM